MHPFSTLTVERRNHLLRLSVEKGDQVRRDRRNADIWLVSSSQYAHVWYRVSLHDGTCGCKWNQERQSACRHLVRASWEAHQARKAAHAA